MAEAITYADLRFVRAPLKKSVSGCLGQDPEADEDGELTYENVQVPSAPVGPSSWASSGLGDKAGVKSQQPAAAWSSTTSPAARRILPGRAACLQYLLLGLLLVCLLLGVAAICLGVRYLQVFQQLQQVNRILEATNGSLRQQLHQKITQLRLKEEDLQGSRRELAKSQEALQTEQRVHQAAEGQLQDCQSDREKTKQTLQNEEGQRQVLEQRLNTMEQRLSTMEDRLKSFFTCTQEPDTCCPVGWIQIQKSCFYISLTPKNWQESQKHCESLSSKLATFREIYTYSFPYRVDLSALLPAKVSEELQFWVGLILDKDQQWTSGMQYVQS
ncbi:B-cell differentiation antigen CD72 [Carlito syrichta]|uniref:B-cell differentiation antigen CD72 n=1 Tax=Carlito syrichta TaxID=1868482 RepID=A0A3Q0E5A7_CARSF|nr:B-cell differentiation antigen CD72 [Carlito syrichta]